MSDVQPPEGEGYDLQRLYAERAKPFWFHWADQWWQLPNLQMLDFEIQVQVAGLDLSSFTEGDADIADAKKQINQLFDLIMGVEQGTEWRKVSRPLQPLMDLLNQWSKHSGADMGESSASSGSSASTEKPSRPTSKPSTGSGSRRRSPAKKAAAPPVNS